ncbi:MAG TPA: GPW/gp25 family protein [Symbiobacteriaceae bacterium]|nr:GPW/gp25 family protein [Symbiobacteriaceae bacterium]
MPKDRTDLGIDLALMPRSGLGLSLEYIVAGGDLATVRAEENLRQAIWLRLATPLGELTHLGHPDFGSRLYKLIGRLITPEVLSLARAYVREALRREPRIQSVESLSVKPDAFRPGVLLIDAAVRPVDRAEPLNLSLSFTTEP